MKQIFFLVFLIGMVFHVSVGAKSKPTVFTIGDSTVRNGTKGIGTDELWGWGAPFVQYFDTTKVSVVNMAMGGTSSRSFQAEGLWQKVLDKLKKGDYVLMQFGHNDGGTESLFRTRGSIKGVGEETQTVINDRTKQQEVVHTYGWYMQKMIREAKAKGAMLLL